ncbi:MAG: hydroxyacylglutathione hydrolase [Peptoniphilus sp.]|uniref:hydroxyacylglutathione hydrolase n=1 Tax=Peptoniphilus sp. TaxID=1971214 RepID=UPI002A756098|nr:hydroxyacylglutathione hydrolase [Peptoniphilus sp.]MDY2987712.1 hydroxyacylglutathione hydrolase [Peptoniphilus sp.]
MKIIPIRAFEDNYIWTLIKGNNAVVVDPGEAEPVLKYKKENELNLVGILLTHKHSDHVGGVRTLKNKFDLKVYGPKEIENLADIVVRDGDIFEILDEKVEVIKTSGHTEEHVSYLIENNLFCGDALFLAGCGRVFTGDYEAQYNTIQKFKELNGDTKVFAAHEYSKTNLKFADSVMPSEAVSLAMKLVETLEKEGRPSLPSTIGMELEINPFMKAGSFEEFKKYRDIRDGF